jgi:hypothetical protein
VLIEQLDGFLAVPRLVNFVAGTREGRGKQLPHGRFVFDEENRFLGHKN